MGGTGQDACGPDLSTTAMLSFSYVLSILACRAHTLSGGSTVLADLDVDALVLGDLALEAGHVDLHHVAVGALVIDVARHDERDHDRPQHERHDRIDATLVCHRAPP